MFSSNFQAVQDAASLQVLSLYTQHGRTKRQECSQDREGEAETKSQQLYGQ